MKLFSPRILLKRGLVMVCVSGVVLFANSWRHPVLPEQIGLPLGARVVYSLRYFNPLMTGAALYYRIESPLSQRETAVYFNRGREGTTSFSSSAVAAQRTFKDVAMLGSAHDEVLVFHPDGPFPTESDASCECRVWKTASTSTAEMLVWTKF